MKGAQGLTGRDVAPEQLEGWRGKVISEVPYVQLLSVPAWVDGEWRAVANVAGMLCLIEVTLRRSE